MGLRFRKSFKFGPARINLSKSGIGYSVGTKVFRVTKTAKGTVRTTASIPGTGISHVTETNAKKNKSIEPNIPNNTNNSNDPKRTKKSKKKFIFIAIAALFVIYIIGSSNGDDPVIEEIKISASDVIETSEKSEVEYTISPDEFDIEGASLRSENSDIASFVLEGDTLYVQGNSAGSTELWLEKNGVESNKISVSVTEPEIAQVEEPVDHPAGQPSEPTQQPSEQTQQPIQEPIQQPSEPSAPVVDQPSTPSEPTEEMVYIAGSGEGTKYHSNPDCSNMSNPIEIPLSEAIADGYEPCKRSY